MLQVVGWSDPHTRANHSATPHCSPSASPGQFNSTYLTPKRGSRPTVEPLSRKGNYSLHCLPTSGFPTNQSANAKNGNFKFAPVFNSTYLVGDPKYDTTDPVLSPNTQEYSLAVLQGNSGANDTADQTLKNILTSVMNLPIAQAEY